MTRICAHCGTEVDEEALFCPTCGEPIEPGAEPQLPPAPDWPELPARPIAASAPEPESGPHAVFHEEEATPEPTASDPAVPEPVVVEAAAPEPPEAAEPTRPAAHDEPAPDEHDQPDAPPPPFLASSPAADEAGQVTHGWEQPTSQATVPPWRRGVAHRATEAPPVIPAREAPPQPATAAPPPAALPRPAGMIQPPALLSDWLIGGGALVATVAMFLPWRIGGAYTSGWGMASGVNVLYAIALLGVLAVVFLPHWLPLVPRRTLVLLAVGLVGVGIGLDRLGMALTGAGASIFLIAAVAMAAGGLIAELGYDRHLGGPQA